MSNKTKTVWPVFPESRGLFSSCVRWADEYGKRNLCHGLTLTLIQPPSTTLERMPHDMFADCDLSPHSFTVIPLLLREPIQPEVSREDQSVTE